MKILVDPSTGKVESFIERQDTLNHEGISLFDSYQTLWQAVHENETDILPQKETIENAMRMLATYPFEEVSRVMTDYVRSRSARILGLLFSPYSKKQNEALQRLLHQYPSSKEDKTLLDDLIGKLNKINTYLEETDDDVALTQFKPMLSLIKDTCKLVYSVPVKYLWIIADKTSSTLNRVYTYNGEIPEVKAVMGYLAEYRSNATRLKAFELQLIDDISTILVFTYPHPQMVIAIENAINTLSLYYSPIQASTLFIDDTEYKMKRYLEHAKEYLGEQLINRFRHCQKEDNEKEYTPAEIYQRMVNNLNRYLIDNDKSVIGALALDKTLLEGFPWQHVHQLPEFKLNMARVTIILKEHVQGK